MACPLPGFLILAAAPFSLGDSPDLIDSLCRLTERLAACCAYENLAIFNLEMILFVLVH